MSGRPWRAAAARTSPLLRFLGQTLWAARGRWLLFAAYAAGRAACLGGFVYFLHRALSLLAAGSGLEARRFALCLGFMSAFQLGSAVAQYLGEEVRRRVGAELETAALRWLLERCAALPAAAFAPKGTDKLVVRIEKFRSSLVPWLEATTRLATRVFVLIGIVSGGLLASRWFGALGLVVLVGVTLVSGARLRRLRAEARRESDQEIGFARAVDDLYADPQVARVDESRAALVARFAAAVHELSARRLRMGRIREGTALIHQLVGFTILAGIFMLGRRAGLDWNAAATGFIALRMALDPLGDILRETVTLRAKWDRLNDFLHGLDQLSASASRYGQRPIGRAPLEEPIACLRFEEVSYVTEKPPRWSARSGTEPGAADSAGAQIDSNEGGDEARWPPKTLLSGLNFEIRRGEIFGVTGRSGAGKTTLARLLLGWLEPHSGTIWINGRRRHEFAIEDYWAQLSAVLAVPPGLSGGLPQQAALGVRGSPVSVRTALEEAGLDPTLERAPYSPSSLQRADWARLWLRRASLVVLDEPTRLANAVDELRFRDSLLRRRSNWMTVLMTHRPALLEVCDRIAVLEAGRIARIATSAELFATEDLAAARSGR